VFNVDGIPDWEVPPFSTDSWIARRYNPRPEQKVAHQTEDARHKDQLPSTRVDDRCPEVESKV
jgi:hypothetical protein